MKKKIKELQYGPEFLLTGEVMQMLRISRNTLKSWRNKNIIKAVNTSAQTGEKVARYLYPKTEIMRILGQEVV